MSCSFKRLSRCECHEVAFEEILRYSRLLGTDDLNSLMERIGFGQTCTACHCDVKALLSEQSREMVDAELEPASVVAPNPRFP